MLHTGSYPVCEPEYCGSDSHLLGVETCPGEQIQCIPEGECKYTPHHGLDAHCELCEPGYEGRLCSRCSKDYFQRGEMCYPCKTRHMAWWIPLFVTGWAVTAIAAATEYHVAHLFGETAV